MNKSIELPRRGWYGPFDLTRRSTFAFFTEESLRFADMDRNGHVNNVAFTVFIENARVSFMTSSPVLERTANIGFVVAHVSVDYLAQLFYPGHVSSACRIVEVRRASLVLGHAIFRGDQCVATGHSIIVMVDHATGKSAAIPEAARARLEQMAQP